MKWLRPRVCSSCGHVYAKPEKACTWCEGKLVISKNPLLDAEEMEAFQHGVELEEALQRLLRQRQQGV